LVILLIFLFNTNSQANVTGGEQGKARFQ